MKKKKEKKNPLRRFSLRCYAVTRYAITPITNTPQLQVIFDSCNVILSISNGTVNETMQFNHSNKLFTEQYFLHGNKIFSVYLTKWNLDVLTIFEFPTKKKSFFLLALQSATKLMIFNSL